MNALVLKNINQPLDFEQVEDPKPEKGKVVVALRAAALNHRDVFITKGQYAGIQTPCILGSDGAGEWGGKPVVLFPSLDWGNDPRVQGKQFRVLGMPDNGTFAEKILIPRTHVFPMPEHLSWEQAAALPLAGVTAYRTLFTRARLKAGQKVLVTGIGGGVALFALQFALAAGAQAYVTSGSADKIQKALSMGAAGGVNYRDADWDKQLRQMAGGFDVIIDSAGGDGFAALPGLANAGGTIALYGGSLGKVNGLSPQIIFWKQLNILGSTMGTARDFKQMLAFVTQHRVVPVVDAIYPLSAGNEAFTRMDEGAQFGKIVLKIK